MASLRVLAGLVALLPACGLGFSSSASDAFDVPAAADGGPVAADAALTIILDAGPSTPGLVAYPDGGVTDVGSAIETSPLCGAAGAPGDAGVGVSCYPGGDSCMPPAPSDPDAGAAGDDDASASVYGCHVAATHVEAGAATVMTSCSAATAGGVAEAPCAAASDCAPGFECVVNAVRAQADSATATAGGVCRHYCCDDTCAGKQDFCDIESTVAGGVSVPVCVSGHAAKASCDLLNDATCGPGLTCQVVNQFTGQVACVTPGNATAGESCESSKCAKGLSCILGYFPARECAQLCYLDDDNCPSGAACTPSAGISSVNAQIGACSQ